MVRAQEGRRGLVGGKSNSNNSKQQHAAAEINDTGEGEVPRGTKPTHASP